MMPMRRRQLLQRAAALAGGALAASFARVARAPGDPLAGDRCTTPAVFDVPLHVPRRDGLMGRLDLDQRTLVLRAARNGRDGPPLAYVASAGDRAYLDPTLVARTGDRVRIQLVNDVGEPTVTHWHGFTIDTANDGNGDTLVPPGAAFDYAFEVRNRAGLYWYHPHPHGLTAGQAYRGLFGLFAVEDADELALRRTLALLPGETELPLVLTDRRSHAPRSYTPAAQDLLHGWYGDEVLVNFTPRPYLDVAARRYRLRVLNAANARIFRLAFTRGDGGALPFLLVGTDGGLLETAHATREVFVAPAERVDLLVNFGDVPVGAVVRLESRAFDPMHAEIVSRAGATAGTHAATQGAPTAAADSPAHAGHSDGAAFALLEFRIRERASAAAPLPARLSTLPPLPQADEEERPLRLGFAKGRWRINDLVYDAGATPIVAPRDAVETWLIRNYHASMPHAMHLHGFQFRVLARETTPEDLASLAIDAQGRQATDLGLKDTVLVWPGESVRIAIDFRIPFPGPQIYLFHCHNLEHEDGGMMLRVRVG